MESPEILLKDDANDLTHNSFTESQKKKPASKQKKIQKSPKSKPQKPQTEICGSVRELEMKVQEIKKKLTQRPSPKAESSHVKAFNLITKEKQDKYQQEKIERYNKRMELKILESAQNWAKTRQPQRNENFREDCVKFATLLNESENEDISIKFHKILKLHSAFPVFSYYEPDLKLPENLILVEDWLELSPNTFYKGEMKNHNPEGRGFSLSKSEIYEGYFSEGKRQGLGRSISSQKHYTGYWLNNQYSGFGTLVKKSSTYSGEFEFGKESGLGILKTKEARYEGEWSAGKQHGQGIIKFEDNRMYKGAFCEGIIKGFGTIILKNGKSLVGYWEDGEIVGESEKVYLDKAEMPAMDLDEGVLNSAVRSEQEFEDSMHGFNDN